MDTVVIYPGRFHPFHKGHKSVYDTLVKRFGKNRVFIATSDVVDPPKSPFTFEEKREMIALTGIDPSRVIKTKSPYQATEITDNYDPQNTIALFAVSDKDMAEDPRFSFKPKKDGSPSYYQPAQKNMEGFDKHGYILTIPTLQFNVLGKPMRSASEFRANFAKADTETQKKMITDLFGNYNANVDRIMSAKIIETLIRADEILDKLIDMGADDHYILEACRRVDALTESLMNPRKSLFKELKKDASRLQGRYDKLRLIKPIKNLPNFKQPNKPTKFDRRKILSLMPEGKKNCGCGQDPCITYGIAVEDAVTVTINGKTMDISHLGGKTPYDKTQSFNKIFAKNYSKHNTKAPNYTFHHKGKQIGQVQNTGNIHYKNPKFNTEEITKFNNVDPMNSVIAIRGIGTMTIPQALSKVAEMSDAVSKLAQELDHKDIQDNIPRYMSLLATYNDSIQDAYRELAQQRKRGGTKSRGIDPDIQENVIGNVIDKFKTDFKKRDHLFAKGGVKEKPTVKPKQKPIPDKKQ